MFRYRWAVVVLWIFLLCFLALFAYRTPSLLHENGFAPKGSSSVLGIEVLEKQLGMSSASIEIVMESIKGENLTTTASQQRIWSELSSLRSKPFVKDMYTSIVTRKAGEDGITAVTVLLNLTPSEALQQFDTIRAAVPQVSGTNTYIAGNTAVYSDLNMAVKRDIVHAEIWGIPIALLILLFIFRTLPAALAPLIIGLSSVTITMGILYFFALADHSISNFTPNMVTMLGLAVGIDYALIMVSRFREELQSKSTEEALVNTCRSAGKAVLFSGLAVWAGLFALNGIRLPVFYSLSLGGMLVVMVSVLAACTLLPALLGIMGHRIHALPIKLLRGPSRLGAKRGDLFGRAIHLVMARPVVTVMLVMVVLVAAMLPAANMKLGIPSSEMLPPTYESRYGTELMKKVYEVKEINSIQIAAVLSQSFDDPLSVKQVKAYMSSLRKLPNVNRVESYASLITGSKSVDEALTPGVRQQIESRHVAMGKAIVVAVVPEYGETDERTMKLIKEIRRIQPEGMNIFVTGSPAYKLDIMDRILTGLPFVIGFVFVTTYLILFAAFRSVLLPLKAVLMNVLSLGASLGIVVLVFQHGYGADFFQVSYTGSVFALLPVLIFCVVFGISMDYEVMMLSRIMEAYKRTGDNERSTITGLQQTGGIITGAACILVAVVGAFIFTDNEVMKAIGLGLTTAVIIDVTIVRMMLVPALMKLLGNANWWMPKFCSAPEERENKQVETP
ncbi:MMPL protein [Paenibacillus pini JCM 16418]|uniref:MMPL protein n=2 Tax=Paenibacillus TaxID=44249 RepID=W7YFK8_9BACL|nr:MMPL protein [Paenibacillus pini JCM 16418]